MPIFVQWKWMERTRSFLVIFHFYDDGRKPNLRFDKRKFVGPYGTTLWGIHPIDHEPISKDRFKFDKTVMTWAPSHLELGYLGEILRYANIIDGLRETEKRELGSKIEITVRGKDDVVFTLHKRHLEDFLTQMKDKVFLSGFYEIKDGVPDFFWCTELCPEYIDYLKKTLEPYI